MATPRGRGGRRISGSSTGGRGSGSVDMNMESLEWHTPSSEGSSAPDTRTPFQMFHGTLFEPPGFSHAIFSTFNDIPNPTGFTWAKTPSEVKQQYFEEFRKYFYWPPQWEKQVHAMWQKRASKRFSDWNNGLKKRKAKGKPDGMTEERWTALCAYWDSPEAREKSEKASRNRLSESEPGCGISKHKGGSRSSNQYGQKIALEKGIPLHKAHYDTFMAIHFKDGKSSNMKALKIQEQVKQIATLEGSGADLNDIFLRVDGAKDKKRRLYGNPHATSSHTTDTDDTAQPSVHELQAIVESEREARRALESKVDGLERLISGLAAASQGPSSRRDEDSNSQHSSPPA